MTFVASLDPKPLWQHFDEILKIPRGSKNEERIRRYVIGVAEQAGCEHEVDKVGNVVVRKPGSAGHENAPRTGLQSHLDMVNEKNSDVDHDFDKDPIEPVQAGEYLKARGTTLGSDNGIGVAAMLAILEAKDLVHGPLELIFTIDEETGLTGAGELDGELVRCRQLINLDSEEEGVLTVGCAGGADSHLSLPVATTGAPAGSRGVQIKLFGLKGGHSGVDIHLQRGNAIKLLARSLWAVSMNVPFHIGTLRGGDKHNAIPREAFATAAVAAADVGRLKAGVEAQLAAIADEFRPAEPDLKWEIQEGAAPAAVYDGATGAKVLELLNALPHGVMAMSYDIPGLVETSTNLATVAAKNGDLSIMLSSRSSVASALAALRQRIRATATLAGAKVQEGDGYPGWKPNMRSHLLEVVKTTHEEVLGSTPEIGAVHAGLECGIIGEKVPGMDMISFGPQIEFPHSPDERVKIASVGDFYRLLTAVLAKLA